jgi:hypothetical protein
MNIYLDDPDREPAPFHSEKNSQHVGNLLGRASLSGAKLEIHRIDRPPLDIKALSQYANGEKSEFDARSDCNNVSDRMKFWE